MDRKRAQGVDLGIDFGTTRTVVAAAIDGRYPLVSFEGEGGFVDHLPGLAVSQGRTLLFGDDARAALRDPSGPAQGSRSLKRTITALAPDQAVAELGGELTALEATTAYLRWLRSMLIHASNLEVDEGTPLRATVAVPANASSGQRFLTLEAFKRAGFEVQAMLGEPTAAAIEYAHHHRAALSERSPKRYVVVYDLGGGTFDTAAVSLEGRRFTLLRSEGITHLGGDDFDALILEAAAERLDLELRALEPRARLLALDACRRAKEGLSSASRRILVDLHEALGDEALVTLDAKAIYERAQPLVDRSIEQVERLFAGLREHGIDPDNQSELGALYLVGGASAFPAVGRALRQRYGRKIQLAPQAHAATAIGLAIAGDPAASIFVREATTRHFGVWREAEGGRRKVFDPIFTKDALAGDDAPRVVRRRYRPIHRVGELRFLECSALDAGGQPEGDLTPWRTIRFPYDPALADRPLAELRPERALELSAQEIVETYTYRDDGTIAVEIANPGGGYRSDYVLGLFT